MLEPVGEVLEQQPRRAGVFDLVVDRDVAGRDQVAGQPVLLAVEDDARPGLEDVRALAEQPRVLGDARASPAAHDHDLGAGPQARLDRPHPEQREPIVGPMQQPPTRPEQRPIEVDVQRVHVRNVKGMALRGCETVLSLSG